MEGWYSSSVVLPDPGTEVVWLAPDGREAVGIYDIHGRWLAPCGQWLTYVPLRWRQSDNAALSNFQPRALPAPEQRRRFVEQSSRSCPSGSAGPSRRKHWVVGLLYYDRMGLQN